MQTTDCEPRLPKRSGGNPDLSVGRESEKEKGTGFELSVAFQQYSMNPKSTFRILPPPTVCAAALVKVQAMADKV